MHSLSGRHRMVGGANSTLTETRWSDIACLMALTVLTVWIFGEKSQLLGFYADDAGFLIKSQDLSFRRLSEDFLTYVPGRNLHILWQYILDVLAGNTVKSLPAHHWVQAAFTALNAALLFVMLRTLNVPALACLLGCALFAFYPEPVEVHFWLSALPMNLVSTSFVLCLMIVGIKIVRAVARSEYKKARRLLVLDFVIYLGAMFTYDQAVPTAVVAASLTGLFCLVKRELWPPAGAFLAAVFLAFASLVQWRLLHSVDAPALPPLNMLLSRILSNFDLSLSVMFGETFVDKITALFPHASWTDVGRAAATAGTVYLVGILLCTLPKLRSGLEAVPAGSGTALASSYRWMTPVVLFVGPAVFFLLSYLPAYMWYLSPRHQYLPSVAAGAGAASLFGLVLLAAPKIGGRLATQVAGCILAAVASVPIYFFALAILVEKAAWITSYQARRDLYQRLERNPKFAGITTLLIEGMPTTPPFGSAPFGYQQSDEVRIFTGGRKQLHNLVRDGRPAHGGEYVRVEATVYGIDAFRHIPAEKLLHLRYEKLQDGKIVYAEPPNEFRPSDYSIQTLPAGGSTEFSVRPAPDGKKGAFLIDLPPLALEQGEVATLLPLVQNGSALEPLTVPSWSGKGEAGKLFLVDAPPPVGAPQRFLLQIQESLAAPAAMRLYVTDEKGHRLVSEARVAAE